MLLGWHQTKKVGVMLCEKCGTPVTASSNFCPKCGNKIQTQQQSISSNQSVVSILKLKSILGLPIWSVVLISVVVIISGVRWVGNSKSPFIMGGWTELGHDESDTSYYDLSSIRRNGYRAKILELTDYKTVHMMGQAKVLSTKNYAEYDCLAGLAKSLSGVAYSGNMGHGEVLGTDATEQPWETVVPETRDAGFLKIACEQSASASTVTEQIPPVKQQTYQEILHGMSDQDLEKELTDANGKFSNALGDKSVSMDTIHQMEQGIGAIESEMVSRRSAQMSQHDKDVIAAADSNYNPQAAKWITIDKNDISSSFVDENSIQDMGNSIRRIHTLLDFKKPAGKLISSIDINEFDCGNMAARFVKGDSFSDLDGKGTIIGSLTPELLGSVPGKFIPIGQDEGSRIMRLEYKFACSGSVKKPDISSQGEEPIKEEVETCFYDDNTQKMTCKTEMVNPDEEAKSPSEEKLAELRTKFPKAGIPGPDETQGDGSRQLMYVEEEMENCKSHLTSKQVCDSAGYPW